MGPRERFKELRAAADRTFSQSDIDRIATPVGLDLGDGTPMGVALSVVSEVLAVSNDADGGPLSERSGPIHPRPDLSG
jgi:xanthine dehydrogenase accessory factor